MFDSNIEIGEELNSKLVLKPARTSVAEELELAVVCEADEGRSGDNNEMRVLPARLVLAASEDIDWLEVN